MTQQIFFEEKKQSRIDKYKERAEKARQRAANRLGEADKISNMIPFGQPILVGHHSEGRHRRDLSRIENNTRKGFEELKKAEYYEQRAEAAANNTAIFSDDPEAVTKLKEKIADLEESQARMKAANKIIRSKKLTDQEKREKLKSEVGFDEEIITEILTPDYMGRIGFAPYALQNNNGNIHSCKKRLQLLQKQATEETTEKTINGIRIIDNVEANRLQIFFDGKPPAEIRTQLKRSGLRWAPSIKAWQRHRSTAANYEAERIANLV